MADWPERGQRPPDYWDDDLRAYIDEADTASSDAAVAAQDSADAAQSAADAAQGTADAAQGTADSAASAAGAAQATADGVAVDLGDHLSDTANPHSVTKAQVGLSDVDNTSDVDKPVSTAQAAADNQVLVASAPVQATGSELREAFGSMSDGAAPAAAVTRQTTTNFSFYAGALPYIRDGFLSTTDPTTAQAGSYRIAQLTNPVLRVGARFAFSTYSVDGGLLALSIQATSISLKTEGQVPVCPMHLTISPTTWSLDVNDTDNTAVETVASGTFDVPLTADSTTLHTVEVVLDRDRQKCYVTFPDGDTVEFSDSRFALPGAYVYVEPFKTAGSLSSKANALVREWWADSRMIEVLPQIRSRARTLWKTPVSRNAWVDAGGSNQIHTYSRRGDRVKIRGVVKDGVIGTSCMTLPAATATDRGYRPKASRQFVSVANSALAAFVVNTDGTVVLYAGSTTWFSVECEFDIT